MKFKEGDIVCINNHYNIDIPNLRGTVMAIDNLLTAFPYKVNSSSSSNVWYAEEELSLYVELSNETNTLFRNILNEI